MRPLLAVLFLLLTLTPMRGLAGERPDLLEVLEINGVIDSRTADQVKANVDTINENKSVKAVLLVVKSPGGGVGASEDIYQALSRLKAPVVGWCSNICASGGMYALMSPSIKYIGVSEGTISGSIGVVMQVTKFNRLLDFLKIDNTIFKSGLLKAAGNPTQAATEAEDKYLQGLIDEFAREFYAVVKKARPKIEDWDSIKSARIFIGHQGVKVGLVDAVMSKEAALAKAKELSGSKSIFTRDELKKMSSIANEHTTFSAPAMPVNLRPPSGFGDVPWLIETLKEIRAGEAVQFNYILPMRF